MEREIRMVKLKELRVDPSSSGNGMTASGYFLTYNKPSSDLGFTEIIMPGCFDRSLVEDDIYFLLNHNEDNILGRNKSGTLRLFSDNIGVRFEADLPEDNFGERVSGLMQRGDLDGCSFGFFVEEDRWDYSTNTRWLVRGRLFDGSVVTYPAYPQAKAHVRALKPFTVDGEGHIVEKTETPAEEEVRAGKVLRDELAKKLTDAHALMGEVVAEVAPPSDYEQNSRPAGEGRQMGGLGWQLSGQNNWTECLMMADEALDEVLDRVGIPDPDEQDEPTDGTRPPALTQELADALAQADALLDKVLIALGLSDIDPPDEEDQQTSDGEAEFDSLAIELEQRKLEIELFEMAEDYSLEDLLAQ